MTDAPDPQAAERLAEAEEWLTNRGHWSEYPRILLAEYERRGTGMRNYRRLLRDQCQAFEDLMVEDRALEAQLADLSAALESAQAEVAGLRAARDRVLVKCEALDSDQWLTSTEKALRPDEIRRLLAVPDTEGET